ncbi:MAG: thrombospondin type 3 repeat-containing protein [Elusimicrobiota bacterium]
MSTTTPPSTAGTGPGPWLSIEEGATRHIVAAGYSVGPGWSLNYDWLIVKYSEPGSQDADGDDVSDPDDACPDTAAGDAVGPLGCSSAQVDPDHDGICTAAPPPGGPGPCAGTDNCPALHNPGQEDNDSDGAGDACNPDDDDCVPDNTDNCPLAPNPDQADNDGDGAGDACNPDADDDGVPDDTDNCPLIPNPDQADQDADGLGDLCDPDLDGDGVENEADACPLEDASGRDADQDGCIDSVEQLGSIKGNGKSAANILEAFINQIEAQRGKKLSEEEADQLIEFARNSIAGL